MANNDQRMIKAIEKLFDIIPDELDEGVDELKDGLFSWVGPVLQSLQGQISKLGPRVIQFKSDDYTIIASDSGAIFNTDSGDLTTTIPDSRTWTDGEKFVENAGSNTLSIELFGDQEVSGVEVIFLLPDTLNPVVNLKSNGPGLTLLSDRDNENLIPAVYWETQLGEQMETQLGERLAFRV